MKKSLLVLSALALSTNLVFAATSTKVSSTTTTTTVSSTTTTNDSTSPDGLIKNVVTQVLDELKAQKLSTVASSTRVDKISQVVDQKIMPYADLETTTKMVMGPNWSKATPEQRTAIMKEFKKLLVLTYSGALSRINDEKISYKPLKLLPNDTKAVVKSTVVSDGQSNSLDYKLHKVNGQWKVYDINVLGISLVASYKGDFAQQINKSGIDGLVKFLQTKTAK